jgi:putative transposase
MPRIPRIVIPGAPHHIVHRGNRKLRTFFGPQDYQAYLHFMARSCQKHGVDIWAYCLMPNHVHLIAVPKAKERLSLGISEAHKHYTCYVNQRRKWKGHLWQGRYCSCPMDERHLLVAARYVEQNPVKAKLCETPWDYPWSSARAHLAQRDDGLVQVKPLLDRVDNWQTFIQEPIDPMVAAKVEKHALAGKPMGNCTQDQTLVQV